MQRTTKHKIPTKYNDNMRPNKYKESEDNICATRTNIPKDKGQRQRENKRPKIVLT